MHWKKEQFWSINLTLMKLLLFICLFLLLWLGANQLPILLNSVKP